MASQMRIAGIPSFARVLGAQTGLPKGFSSISVFQFAIRNRFVVVCVLRCSITFRY
jgi:hypothetical protein